MGRRSLALIVFRRWRHLFVFIGAIIVLEVLAYQIGVWGSAGPARWA